MNNIIKYIVARCFVAHHACNIIDDIIIYYVPLYRTIVLYSSFSSVYEYIEYWLNQRSPNKPHSGSAHVTIYVERSTF